jgi:hypothetical protein
MKTHIFGSGLRHFLRLLMVILLLAAVPAGSANAAGTDRYVVAITGLDSGDCTSTPCLSVAYAITQSNDGDTIHIAVGDYGYITVDKNLTFIGEGMNSTFLNGWHADRVVEINSGKVVTFKHLTIRNGSTPDSGGGILSYGDLTLSRVTVTGSVASFGGGIYSSGALTIIDSVISQNTASGSPGNGGGLALLGDDNDVNLTRVTISDNTAEVQDGGIHDQINNMFDGSLTLTNVTISGNTAPTIGGFYINNEALVHVINSTIANNHASVAGHVGGISDAGKITFWNTIVANNDNVNCERVTSSITFSMTSLGHNLDSRNDCGFTATGDLINTDPLLGALADNGGPTETMALGVGSPAIDAGANAGCPALDQRSLPRPVGAKCDIGAFELGYTISGNVSTTGAGTTLSFTDGIAKTVTADSSGDYSLAVSYDWTGVVLPSLAGFTFSPDHRSYANVTVNKINQDYTPALIATYTFTPTQTRTPTTTSTRTPTNTTSPTATRTSSRTPTQIVTASITNTPTKTRTNTATSTRTSTPTKTATKAYKEIFLPLIRK